jgi:hypothetical protein
MTIIRHEMTPSEVGLEQPLSSQDADRLIEADDPRLSVSRARWDCWFNETGVTEDFLPSRDQPNMSYACDSSRSAHPER